MPSFTELLSFNLCLGIWVFSTFAVYEQFAKDGFRSAMVWLGLLPVGGIVPLLIFGLYRWMVGPVLKETLYFLVVGEFLYVCGNFLSVFNACNTPKKPVDAP